MLEGAKKKAAPVEAVKVSSGGATKQAQPVIDPSDLEAFID